MYVHIYIYILSHQIQSPTTNDTQVVSEVYAHTCISLFSFIHQIQNPTSNDTQVADDVMEV